MRIILLRHGRPEIDLDALGKHWVTAQEFGEVVRAYETSSLDAQTSPSISALELSSSIQTSFCSDLERAKDSCVRLGEALRPTVDPAFNEAGMPYTEGKLIRLPIKIWSLLFRVRWLYGFDQNAVSIEQTKQRAEHAATILADAAAEHDEVLLVGHGIFNRFIGNELRKQHWNFMASNGEGYWSYSVFEKHQL